MGAYFLVPSILLPQNRILYPRWTGRMMRDTEAGDRAWVISEHHAEHSPP